MSTFTYLLLVGSLGGQLPIEVIDTAALTDGLWIGRSLTPADGSVLSDTGNINTGAFRRLLLKACPGSNPSLAACPA